MKKDLESIAITLNNETVYVQLTKYHEREEEWHIWREHAHNHRVYEVHFLTKGACRLNVEGELVTLQQGQAILLAPNQYHEPHALTEEMERVSFFFMPDDAADSLRAELYKKVKQHRVFAATEEMLYCGRTLLRDWLEDTPYRKEKRKALLTTLLIDIFRQLEFVTKEQQDMNKEPSRMFLCDAYFSTTVNRSAQQLARYLRMSERQMNRCLMEFYGMSFQQKLVQTRMERASWLLRTTEKSVSQIAEEVGYDAESGFYKEFRKRYGMTPLRYRKENESL